MSEPDGTARMWEATLGLSDQLRWAADADVPEVPPARTALVTGMGGSGISGDVAALVAGAAGKLVAVHKGYGLPPWAAAERPLVIAASYSGNTEETLSVAEDVRDAGLPAAVVGTGGRIGELAAENGWPVLSVPGGLQPRAALGYLAGSVLRILESAGLLDDQTSSLREAAATTDELWGASRDGAGMGLASDLAEGLADRIAVAYGGQGVGAVAAYRWKCQINENAKRAAYAGVLPELDHNEVVGWGTIQDVTRAHVGIVHLRDARDHPRVARRFEFTADIVAPDVAVVGEVWAQGESELARFISLATVGDLVSMFLAEQTGTDPLPVAPIEDLKSRLARIDPAPSETRSQ